MSSITQKEAVLLASANAIDGATIQETFRALDFRVAFAVRGEMHWLHTARGQMAEFKTVDAAVSKCRHVFSFLPIPRKPHVVLEFL